MNLKELFERYILEKQYITGLSACTINNYRATVSRGISRRTSGGAWGLQRQIRPARWLRDLREFGALLREAPADGRQRAKPIYQRQRRIKRPKRGRRASPAARCKQLAREVYEKWARVWHQTNNATERVIGLSLKIRAKQMRGFKVAEHISGLARLRGWMMSQGERVEPSRLL